MHRGTELELEQERRRTTPRLRRVLAVLGNRIYPVAMTDEQVFDAGAGADQQAPVAEESSQRLFDLALLYSTLKESSVGFWLTPS